MSRVSGWLGFSGGEEYMRMRMMGRRVLIGRGSRGIALLRK